MEADAILARKSRAGTFNVVAAHESKKTDVPIGSDDAIVQKTPHNGTEPTSLALVDFSIKLP
jgi:hypothetical protein